MATKNNIYLEWDILYESVKTKKERNKVIKTLLNGISNKVKPGGESIALKYEIFQSETNKLLYILRVYKVDEQASVAKNVAAPASVTSRAAVASMDIESSDSSSESFSGPTRPSGPPSQIPPGVMSLS